MKKFTPGVMRMAFYILVIWLLRVRRRLLPLPMALVMLADYYLVLDVDSQILNNQVLKLNRLVNIEALASGDFSKLAKVIKNSPTLLGG